MGYGVFYRYATEPYNTGLDRDLEHLFDRAVKEIDRECKDLNQPYLVLRDALDHLADRFWNTAQPEAPAEQSDKTMAPAIGIGAAALAVLAAAVLLLGRKKRKK